MPRGVTVKTPERVELAAELRAEGKTHREIGELLGVGRKAVHSWLSDPDGSMAAARHEAHRLRSLKPCVDCGTPIDGTHGTRISERCQPCAHAESKVWTPEAIMRAIEEWTHEHGEPPAVADWNAVRCRRMNDEDRARRYEEGAAAGKWPSHVSVVRAFGSWNEALVAAGFEPRAPHGGGGNEQRRRSMRAQAER